MNKIFATLFAFFAFSLSVFSADMKIIQVDNLEYKVGDDRLDKIINDINKQKNLDFVIFSGNNIAKPRIENLEEFVSKTKNIKAPVYIVLGNKDVNKQKGLGKSEYTKYLSKNLRSHKKINSTNYVIDKKEIVFIILDGSKEVIPTSMGYYKPETTTWLDEQLGHYANKNIIIIQHFPIIPPSEKETHYTAKPEAYLKVLAKHNNVKAIISGHFGVNKEEEHRGIKFISTSSAPAYKIIDIIDYDSKNPIFWSTVKE